MMGEYKPLIIGHRGAKALVPENTLGSFKKGFSLGADMIEFDVHLTRDKVLVVMHDFTVTRTTRGRGRISKMTLAQFQRLRCANSEAPPTLAQVLRLAKGRPVNVEIKTVNAAGAVADMFRDREHSEVLFSSFRWEALEIVRRRLPDARLGILLEHRWNIDRAFIAARKLNAETINPSVQMLTPAFMTRAKASRLAVLVYGFRNDGDLLRAFALRADGVFADDPGLARRLLKNSAGN